MKQKVLLLLVEVILFFKCFTSAYTLPDVPTSGLIVKPSFSLVNRCTIAQPNEYITLARGENGFFGEYLYGTFTNFGWLIAIALILFYWYRSTHTGTYVRRQRSGLTIEPHRLHTLLPKLFLFSTVALWFSLLMTAITSANHLGFDIRNLQWLYFGWIIYFSLSGLQKRKGFALTCIATAILTITVLYTLVYYNVLTPYELWLQRGMPERFTL